jgi:hypothetical protein
MTLNDPPNAFAREERPKIIVEELQLKQCTSRILALKPLAVVALHRLLLLAFELRLHVYAPTKRALIEPPIEFSRKELPEVVLEVHLKQGTSTTLTLRPLAVVASHTLLLMEVLLKLQAHAPAWRALIDPPKAFAPKDCPETVVEAMQPVQRTLLMFTLRPLADVDALELLLLAA